MKAIAIKTFGGPEGLELIDLPDPVPADGEVLIATEAIGVGGVDALIRSGALSRYGFKEGHILGSEVAGTVVEVGPGVDPSWVGRRVWAFVALRGGYAERVLVAAAALIPLPDEVSAPDAVTLGTSGLVAHFALRHGHFAPGESVLVRGAAGGIGVLAVQLARQGGAAVVGVTTSSAERGQRLRDLGATLVLDRAGTGDDGFDVILDVIAGPELPRFIDKLNPNGRFVEIGLMGGLPPADFGLALFAGFQHSRSFATFSADTVPEADKLAFVADLLAKRELRAVVHDTLPLAEAARAHQMMDAGAVFGRVVLVP